MDRQNNPYTVRLQKELLPKIRAGQVVPQPPAINAAWFRDHGSSIPAIGWGGFDLWWQKTGQRLSLSSARDLRRYVQEVLICAVGVKPSTADAYLRGAEYYKKREKRVRTRFNHQTHALLDEVTQALGFPIPLWPSHKEERPWSGRLAIFSELASLPSQRFHFELIRAIARGAQENHCLCSVHEVSQRTLADDIKRIMRLFDLDAAVMLRLTPDPECLNVLRSTPTILIHADRAQKHYSFPPIVCNIVPGQQSIGSCLTKFVEWSGVRKRENPEPAVVASIEMEHKLGSIRDQRILFVLQALAESGLAPQHCIVSDYSFASAIRIFQAFPHASLYVCLSDQLALGLKHCLIASGQEYKRRVVGWDNSEQYAQRENISSFDQGLKQIADQVFDALTEIIQYEQALATNPVGAVGKPAKPAFKEVSISVELARENEKGYPGYVCRPVPGGLYPTFDLR
jgi:DNA-binding LacI/PurR family transcriptional regulator